MAIFGTIDGKAFANNVGVTQTDATVTRTLLTQLKREMS